MMSFRDQACLKTSVEAHYYKVGYINMKSRSSMNPVPYGLVVPTSLSYVLCLIEGCQLMVFKLGQNALQGLCMYCVTLNPAQNDR